MYHLSLALNLNMDVIDEIWNLIKYIFTEKTELLVYRQLDTIIFCSIYVICKVFKINIKFNQII